MSKQIAVRLSEELVEFLDEQVREGKFKNGIDQEGIVICDNILTLPAQALGRIGSWFRQEIELTDAILAAFDVE